MPERSSSEPPSTGSDAARGDEIVEVPGGRNKTLRRVAIAAVVLSALLGLSWWLLDASDQPRDDLRAKYDVDEPPLSLLYWEARPPHGDIDIFGITSADTEVTLFERRDPVLGKFDLKRLDQSSHGGDEQAHLFSLSVPSGYDEAGDWGRRLWLKVQGEIDGTNATRWYEFESTGRQDVRMPEGIDGFEEQTDDFLPPHLLTLYSRWLIDEPVDQIPPKLTIGDLTEYPLNSSPYVENRSALSTRMLLWPIAVHGEKSTQWLTVAAMPLDNATESGPPAVMRDISLELIVRRPEQQPALRKPDAEHWETDIEIDTGPHGIGIFEYRTDFDGHGPKSHPLNARIDKEHWSAPQVVSFNSLPHPGVMVDPPIITPEQDTLSVSMPTHKTPELATKKIDRIESLLHRSPRMMVAHFNDEPVDLVHQFDDPVETTVELDVEYKRDGIGHVLGLTPQMRARRTVGVAESKRDILDDALFADTDDRRDEAAHALAVLWTYQFDNEAMSDPDDDLSIGTLESSTHRHTRFTFANVYRGTYGIHHIKEIAQRDHLRSAVGITGIVILLGGLLFLIGGAVRLTDWRRQLRSPSRTSHLIPVVASTVGWAAIYTAGSLALGSDLISQLQQRDGLTSTMPFLIFIIPAAVALMVMFAERPLSPYRKWSTRHFGIAVVAAITAHFTALHSLTASLLLITVVGVVAVVSLIQLSIGFTVRKKIPTYDSFGLTASLPTSISLDDPANTTAQTIWAVGFALLPLATALITLI